MALFTPTATPRILINGPPELPALMDASICRYRGPLGVRSALTTGVNGLANLESCVCISAFRKSIAAELNLSRSMISSMEALERCSSKFNVRMSQLLFFAEELEGELVKKTGGKLNVSSRVLAILEAIYSHRPRTDIGSPSGYHLYRRPAVPLTV